MTRRSFLCAKFAEGRQWLLFDETRNEWRDAEPIAFSHVDDGAWVVDCSDIERGSLGLAII